MSTFQVSDRQVCVAGCANLHNGHKFATLLMLYKVVLRILRETSTAKYQSVIVARVPSRMATGGQTSDVAAKIAKNLVQNVRTKEVGINITRNMLADLYM